MSAAKQKKSGASPDPKIKMFRLDRPSKKDKDQMLMITLIIILMLLIFAGWVWSLKFSFRLPPPSTDDVAKQEQWKSLKAEMGQSFANIKQNMDKIKQAWDIRQQTANLNQADIDKLKVGITKEIMADWISYSNFDQKFSLKYPPTWQQTTDKDKVILSADGKPMVTIAIQKLAPRPTLAEEKTEIFFLDTLEATLYHDATKTGAPEDKIIATLPDEKNDVILTGYGETFEQIASTFKFIK